MTLPQIPKGRRRCEEELWKAFEEVRPKILAGLLNAECTALANIENTQLKSSPRMSDFARWVVAAEPALPWPPGKFMEVYEENCQDKLGASLEENPVAASVIELLKNKRQWTGTATALLDTLDVHSSQRRRTGKEWPRSPRQLSGKLRLAASSLRSIGVEVEFKRENGTGRKLIELHQNNSQP